MDALADVAALSQARQLYEDGLSGMEEEYTRYMEAVAVLEGPSGAGKAPSDQLNKAARRPL